MASSEEGRSYGVEWKVHSQHGLTTVSLRGELDLASVDAVQTLAETLLEGSPVLVFDLLELEFLDSTGLRMLGRLHQRAEREGRRFLLAQVSGPARRVMRIAGLLSYFEYVEGAPPAEVMCPNCEAYVVADLLDCPQCGAAL